MSRIKIEIEDIVGIAGNDYRLERRVPGGYFLRSVDSPSFVEFFEDAELELTDKEGLLSFRSRLVSVSPKHLEEAHHRQAMCEVVLDLLETGQATLSDRSLRKASTSFTNAAIDAAMRSQAPTSGGRQLLLVRRTPSPSTVRRWLRSYDGTTASVLRAQASARRTDPLQDFSRRVADAFRRAADLYVGPRKMPVTLAYREFRRELLLGAEASGHAGHALNIPSARTFRQVLLEIVDVAELRDGRTPRGRDRAA